MVLGDVPRSERCRCREAGAPTTGPKTSAKAKGSAAQAAEPEGTLAKFAAWLRK